MSTAGGDCPKLELVRSSVAADSGDLNEDKDIASQAVLFVMSGARRGAVHLCAGVAQLMRENRRLQQITQAQEALIEELNSCSSLDSLAVDSAPSTSNQPHLPPLPDSHPHRRPSSPPPPVSFHLPPLPTSSCTPERQSLSTTGDPPHLPHLTSTPDPHPTPPPVPITPHPPSLRQRSDEGARTQKHYGISGQKVKKPEGEHMKNLPPVFGNIPSKTQSYLKKRDCFLKRTTSWKKEEQEKEEEEAAASSQGEIHQLHSIRVKGRKMEEES
ncbi:uncharacterized protein LOC143010040 isoform X2 [Genypterus blacodes]|uniref:uncharacterized protein LOC143010040 isoform X2 n=1 Tax=Genypterus blacodes TaxID=154954 RepID=UPI003F76F172